MPKDQILNDIEVWKMTNALADPTENAIMAVGMLTGRDYGDVTVYGPEPISGNLLKTASGLLKTATAKIVGSSKRATFYFAVGPKAIAGTVMIAPPPLVYERNDLAVMFGMISHELRHAADFVALNGDDSAFHKLDPSAVKIDMQAYASNIMEARAFAEQISQMLRLMGGRTDLVIEALEKNAPLFPPEIKKVARILLEEIAKDSVKESFDPNPPAIVRGMEEEAPQKIVRLLGEIIERLSFSNNIKRD